MHEMRQARRGMPAALVKREERSTLAGGFEAGDDAFDEDIDLA
jgi:hypothetical protein